ncbi:hypothetical protein CLU79DRAFT_424776 [Phycomyces nitens]|nr:hypothetical protein CLU79DRAFT_424776 [Phycomyces nitens]
MVQKMTLQGFWGVRIEPNRLYRQMVSAPFQMIMVALDHKKAYSSRSSLFIRVGKNEHTLCSLSIGQKEQQYMNIGFAEGEYLELFIKGSSTMHLTGNYIFDSNSTLERSPTPFIQSEYLHYSDESSDEESPESKRNSPDLRDIQTKSIDDSHAMDESTNSSQSSDINDSDISEQEEPIPRKPKSSISIIDLEDEEMEDGSQQDDTEEYITVKDDTSGSESERSQSPEDDIAKAEDTDDETTDGQITDDETTELSSNEASETKVEPTNNEILETEKTLKTTASRQAAWLNLGLLKQKMKRAQLIPWNINILLKESIKSTSINSPTLVIQHARRMIMLILMKQMDMKTIHPIF